MFTRQHFQAFAEMVRDMKNPKDQEILAIKMIKLFKADNKLFQAGKFLEAAGIENNPRIAQAVQKESKMPVKEAFENMKMKLGPLLPVAQLEARGTLVREGPKPTMDSPNDDKVMVIEDAEQELEQIEYEMTDRIDDCLAELVKYGKQEKMDTMPLARSIKKVCGKAWGDVRNLLSAEIKKVEGKR